MIENYTDAATRYSDKMKAQELGNTSVTKDSGKTNVPKSIPPNQRFDSREHPNHSREHDNFNNSFYSVFNRSNITLLIWFLAIYFVIYYGLGFLFNRNEIMPSYQLRISRTIDIVFFLIIFIILIATFSMSQDDKESSIDYIVNEIRIDMDYPISIVKTSFSLLCFYAIVYLFRIPMETDTKSIAVSTIESFLIIYLILEIVCNLIKYLFNFSIFDFLLSIFDWDFLPQYSPDYRFYDGNINGNVLSGNVHLNTFHPNEVFNISNNLYTYDDAQAICSAYGANIATYDQIEEAYHHGAEWCNYGWSDGQMALFPTQKATWSNLQKNPAHKNDCGRPGINGGYFANPHLKFGVNCYGKKPQPNAKDLARLNTKKNTPIPKTDKDIANEKKVQFWKDNADKLLIINSYNNRNWSEF